MDFLIKIKFDSGEKNFDYLDMRLASKSFVSISRALLTTTHCFINEEIITKGSAAKGFYFALGKSKEGSFDQYVNLIITDNHVLSLIQDLGKDALYDLLKWSFLSVVGIPYVIKNRKAKRKIKMLTEKNLDLENKLEIMLKNSHESVKHQGYITAISLGKKLIVELNKETLEYLETEYISSEPKIKQFAVSRFNVRTGTGRFIDSLESNSYAFSPESYDSLSQQDKSLLASNLKKVAENQFEAVCVEVREVKGIKNKLKRYILVKVIGL
ncbi:hypothetical protein [Francisella philomiragia]|uniref:DUF7946 domain-containing protein n=1 Tax=Francisella philomiragia TaxID=28110 RepID=UPI001C9DADFF|nr:hypothetical protein [Francisella philomiragia]MBY7734831.1 hypothetical protein [Francisella philomiragia]